MIHQSHSWAYIQINYNSNRYMHPVFITALFIKAKTWKQPKCSLTEECIKKMWYCGTYVQWNITQPLKRMKSGHFQQHRWT